MEETIRDRLRAAEDRKKRIMAAYDHAAKTQPAGQARIVEFDTFSSADGKSVCWVLQISLVFIPVWEKILIWAKSLF